MSDLEKLSVDVATVEMLKKAQAEGPMLGRKPSP